MKRRDRGQPGPHGSKPPADVGRLTDAELEAIMDEVAEEMGDWHHAPQPAPVVDLEARRHERQGRGNAERV